MLKVIKSSARSFGLKARLAFRAFDMLKVILVALFCLFGVTAVFALRSINHDKAAELAAAVPSSRSTAHSADDPTETFAVNSAAKADKLSVVRSGEDSTKMTMDPVQPLPIQPGSKTGTKAPITNWHWSAGSNKITRK